MEIGTICVKIAGRDAGKKCVIIEAKENRFLIDGETRRREVNPTHLAPTKERLDIGSGSHEEVKKAFETIGIKLVDTKPKQKTERPKRMRKPPAEKKPKKKTEPTEKKTAKKKAVKKAVKQTAKKEENTDKKE